MAIFGALMAGLTCYSLSESITIYEFKASIMKMKPKFIVCPNRYLDAIVNEKDNFTFIKTMMTMLETVNGPNHNNIINNNNNIINNSIIKSVEEICLKLSKTTSAVVKLPVHTEPDNHVTYFMSSGTTGQPKAIIRTNKIYLSVIECLIQPNMIPQTSGGQSNDIYLSDSIFHSSGHETLIRAIVMSTPVAVLRSEDSMDDIYQCIHNYRISQAFMTPAYLSYLVKNMDKYTSEYLGSLKCLYVAGDFLNYNIYKSVKQYYNIDNILMVYGMSEMGFICQSPPDIDNNKYRSTVGYVGKVCPNLRIKILNDSGSPLPANSFGKLYVSGLAATLGYLNDPEQTNNLLTNDGYVITGDIGYYDDNHNVYIVGRSKDIIKVYGNNVMPSELENVLSEHRYVMKAAVIGIDDDLLGSVPMAFVTVDDSVSVSEEELMDYVDKRVSDHKRLRGGIKIVDSMPVNHMNKVIKSQLRKLIL
ncbi:uncharacterized protein LOC128960054 [Oppia nitens]|uniref:uncharacterized protein LOC128960054 n=1 Tax=Oppia nitens TaxID=1686743 RepID=UPI0023DC2700|nr:uncharacterized protein LOC128960054 [Oppia nitens]